MTCEHVKELIADDLTDTLSAAARAEFHAHLADCRGCAEEAESLRETWRSLGLLEPEQPSSALPSRFYQSLAAYRQGLNQAAIPAENQFREARRAWWSRQPVFQFAFSCTLLVVGAAVGHLLTLNHQDRGELAHLQKEVYGMRQMVTLSLLQQQSASERLRGVDWSYRVDQSDTQVLSALLYAVNHDPNVNVRLAAVDALRKFFGSPMVRKLDRLLSRQDSPLVQIALIDLMVETRDRDSMPALKSLLTNRGVNPEVKERAGRALAQLAGSTGF